MKKSSRKRSDVEYCFEEEDRVSKTRMGAEKETGLIISLKLVMGSLFVFALLLLSGVNRVPGIVYQAYHRHVDGKMDAATSQPPIDVYLGGLLSEDLDSSSCRSRLEYPSYRKPSPHKPSPYLLRKLRQYEDLHRRCSPHSSSFNESLTLLTRPTVPNPRPTDCKYLIWTPFTGLGNRVLALVSSFLYAVLTGRVLLIDDRSENMEHLFCEPFPSGSWLLPPGFPFDLQTLDSANLSYGKLMRSGNVRLSRSGGIHGPPLSLVYAYLIHVYDNNDKRFFCEQDQKYLNDTPWMVIKSDNYFGPGLFLNQIFQPELHRMFPDKETVFHFLVRYLLHPSDLAWGMIVRYYDAYLSTGREKLGIQIRIFRPDDSPRDLVADQMVKCALGNGLLPPVSMDNHTASPQLNSSKVVLVTSLYSQFSDRIRAMYWENPSEGGEVIRVQQPSHEEWQQTGSKNHNLKALSEMYLLSLSDVLLTSAQSTFGYIAQGLAGIRPWVLVKPQARKMPEPACFLETSMEPCFHAPPMSCVTSSDPVKEISYVKHCTDFPYGIKLVGETET